MLKAKRGVSRMEHAPGQRLRDGEGPYGPPLFMLSHERGAATPVDRWPGRRGPPLPASTQH